MPANFRRLTAPRDPAISSGKKKRGTRKKSLVKKKKPSRGTRSVGGRKRSRTDRFIRKRERPSRVRVKPSKSLGGTRRKRGCASEKKERFSGGQALPLECLQRMVDKPLGKSCTVAKKNPGKAAKRERHPGGKASDGIAKDLGSRGRDERKERAERSRRKRGKSGGNEARKSKREITEPRGSKKKGVTREHDFTTTLGSPGLNEKKKKKTANQGGKGIDHRQI